MNMTITTEREQDLSKLAQQRRDAIIDAWWYEDIGEWADEEEMTDEELEYALTQ